MRNYYFMISSAIFIAGIGIIYVTNNKYLPCSPMLQEGLNDKIVEFHKKYPSVKITRRLVDEILRAECVTKR